MIQQNIPKLDIHPLSNTLGQIILASPHTYLFDLNKTEIIRLFQKEGALLFRGFTTCVDDFTQFTNQLSQNFMDYTGGVFNRKAIKGDATVLSVNDFNHGIKLHGEMYYQKKIPHLLWFFCVNPASNAGETIIGDGKRFYDELSQPLKDLFQQKKLKYQACLDQKTWQKRYKTNDLSVVQQICRESDIHVQINQDQSLNLHYICPAIYPNLSGKSFIFINSILPTKVIAPDSVSFEDDSKINAEIIAELNEIAEKITVEIQWQKGDILMLDNTRIMHGRRAFKDETREIYLRLCFPAFSA